MKRLFSTLFLALILTFPFSAPAQQLGGAGNNNGWQLPAGSNYVTVGDGRDSQYTTIAAALADIAADAYGWGVPDGTAPSRVTIIDHRKLTTEQPVVPAGILLWSPEGTIHLADVSGGTPGVTVGPGGGIKGYLTAVIAGPGAPGIKVDLDGATGSELHTIVSSNFGGGLFSAATDAILVVGGHQDSEVVIENYVTKLPGTNADIETANTFLGTLRVDNSNFGGDLIMNAATVGDERNGVIISNSNFDDMTINSTLFRGSSFIGGSASTLTFAAVGNAARTVRMTIGALTDNSTAGVLTQVSDFQRTAVSDADYNALLSDNVIAYTALTDARTVTLPAADGQPRNFKIKDESGDAGTYNITIDVSGGGTIDGLSSTTLRNDYGVTSIYSNGTAYFSTCRVRNSGQVKINSGGAGKPTLTWTGIDTGTFKDIQYNLPLTTAAAPTTSWPQNIDTPADSDIYDDTNETFIENTVPGQTNQWRMIFDYSGKSAGTITGVEVRIQNTLSGFTNTQTVAIPSERTSGQFAVEMTTIADGASLPAPWGTGQGYEFSMAADDPITIELDSLVRANAQFD